MHRSLRWLLILLIGELWLVLWVSAQDAKTTALPVKNETVASDKKTILRKLKQFLFKGPDNEYYYYDRDVRPNVFGQLNISAYYSLLAVDTVNEKEGYITTKSGLHLSWMDERLVWNKTDFDNIDHLVFSSYMIWTPTFLHSNTGVISTYADNVVISDNGHCSVMIIMNEETPCFFDMTDFPKDTQTCSIHFFQTGQGTRFISEGAAYLDDFGDNIIGDLAKSIQHRAWNITDVSVHQKIAEAVDQPVDMLVYSITMKRHGNFFLQIYVMPICFLLLLVPSLFLFPAESSEKHIFGVILLFSMIYVSLSLEAVYPPYTGRMPYLMKLAAASCAMLFLCILTSNIVTSAERVARRKPLPGWIKRYVIGKFGKFVFVEAMESSATVHIKSGDSENDRTVIVQHEQPMGTAGTFPGEISNHQDETATSKALQSLTNELQRTRLQSTLYEGWTKFFTIINRLLFVITMIIGFIIILCFV